MSSRRRRIRQGTARRKSEAGSTLVELMVSITLLVGALLALTHAAIVISDLRRADEERSAAAYAVSEQLLAVENTSFEDILDHDARGFSVSQAGAAGEMLEALPDDPDGLPGGVVVASIDDRGDGVHLVEVTVRVDWVGRRGPDSLSRTVRISRFEDRG